MIVGLTVHVLVCGHCLIYGSAKPYSMNAVQNFFCGLFVVLVFPSVLQAFPNDALALPGCTNATACNFNPLADQDDGTCTFPHLLVLEDTAGDGWGGATYSIRGNDGTLFFEGTLATGFNDQVELCLPFGCFTIEVTGGQAPAEITWVLYDPDQIGLLQGLASQSGDFGVGGPCTDACDDPLACNYSPFGLGFSNNGCCYEDCEIVVISGFADNTAYAYSIGGPSGFLGTRNGTVNEGEFIEEQWCIPPGCYVLHSEGEGYGVVLLAPTLGGGLSLPGISEPCYIEDPDPSTGCTSSSACNYEPAAVTDDGSCVECPEGRCVRLVIAQFDSFWEDYTVTVSNDSGFEMIFTLAGNDSAFVHEFCLPHGCNPKILLTGTGTDIFWWIELDGDISNATSGLGLGETLLPEATGCMDPLACNYNPNACEDDGSCVILDVEFTVAATVENGFVDVILQAANAMDFAMQPDNCGVFVLTLPNGTEIEIDPAVYGDGVGGAAYVIPQTAGVHTVCWAQCCPNASGGFNELLLCDEFLVPDPCPLEEEHHIGVVVQAEPGETVSYTITYAFTGIIALTDDVTVSPDGWAAISICLPADCYEMQVTTPYNTSFTFSVEDAEGGWGLSNPLTFPPTATVVEYNLAFALGGYFGCSDPLACNYNPIATCPVGCIYPDPDFTSYTSDLFSFDEDGNLFLDDVDGDGLVQIGFEALSIYSEDDVPMECLSFTLTLPSGETVVTTNLDLFQDPPDPAATANILAMPGEYTVCHTACCELLSGEIADSTLCRSFTILDQCPEGQHYVGVWVAGIAGDAFDYTIVDMISNTTVITGNHDFEVDGTHYINWCLPQGCYAMDVISNNPVRVSLSAGDVQVVDVGPSTVFNFPFVLGGTIGCTDANACNFDPLAICDDQSCTFCEPGLLCGSIQLAQSADYLAGGTVSINDAFGNVVQFAGLYLPYLNATAEVTFCIPQGCYVVVSTPTSELGGEQFSFSVNLGGASAAGSGAVSIDITAGTPVVGCMNQLACNYDPMATCDAFCELPPLYYQDFDLDGYGTNAVPQLWCSPQIGWSLLSGDCDDGNAGINPSAAEVCGNEIDEDCDGTADDGCAPPLVANDNRSSAIAMVAYTFGACLSESGSTDGATDSPQANSTALTGEDVWYRFAANSIGVRVWVQTSSFNAVIELQDAAGNTLATENAVSGIGSEILNYYSAMNPLITGQQYYIAVRNYNSALGTGSFTVCLQRIRATACATGPGPYATCDNFKAVNVGAQSYTFEFTDTGTAEVIVLSSSSGITIVPAGALRPERQYAVTLTANYALADGAGTIETFSILTSSACTITMGPHLNVELRETDRCAAGPKPANAIIGANRWLCGASHYQWRFRQVVPSPDVDFGSPVAGPPTNRFLNLAPLALAPGATYDVQVRPVFTSGHIGNWSTTTRCLSILGSAGMILAEEESSSLNGGSKVNSDPQFSIYPNPTPGGWVQLIIHQWPSDRMNILVRDATGREVHAMNYQIEDGMSRTLVFDRKLSAGVYFIEASDSNTRIIKTLIIEE